MLKQSLGTLDRVDLRTIWVREATDFTPWLAENLSHLSRVLGMNLEIEATERFVGSFRADIVAKDIDSDRWALIENQLERTNHDHLGQLITYAAGLEAGIVIWIAKEFTDEHISVLDWLNKVTDESVSFYGVQIELWCINDVVAPKFNIVSKPNTWTKKGKEYKQAALHKSAKTEFILKCLEEDPNMRGSVIAERARNDLCISISKSHISTVKTEYRMKNGLLELSDE